MHRTRQNLRCRCSVSIDKNCERQFKVERLAGCFVHALVVRIASLCTHYFSAFRHEIRCYLHGALEETATIVAKVDDNAFEVGVAEHGEHGIAHFAGAVFVEGSQFYKTYAIVGHTIVRQRIYFDIIADDIESEERIFNVGSAHIDFHLGAGLSAQTLAYLVYRGLRCHGVAVD